MTDQPELLPDVSDGIEQVAFEEWAREGRMDMVVHPLHYLFLDPTAYSARQAWKAGFLHCKKRMETAAPAVSVKPLEWVDEGARCYAESVLGNWFVWAECYGGPGDYSGILCKPGFEREAAEKEYQRRMAPALTPQPPAVTPEPTVEQAARVLLDDPNAMQFLDDNRGPTTIFRIQLGGALLALSGGKDHE